MFNNEKDIPDFSNLITYVHEIVPGIHSFSVKKENILKTLGMKDSEADDYLNELIDGFIQKCKDICEPLACFFLFDTFHFNPDRNELLIGNEVFSLGKMVFSHLKKSSYVAIFLATCGDKTEQFSKNLIKEGHTLEGLIVDMVGSELAEEVAEYVHREIANIAEKRGLKTTNRYSPGYCNWPVYDQQKLFPLFNGNTCGIHLTPSSLMVPLKSVSGIIGIGQDVKQLAYKCHLCSDEKCILRGRK